MEAEEYRRRNEERRNAFVIHCCVVCVPMCVYGPAESIVACVSFIRFLFFFFCNHSLSLYLSVLCLGWIRSLANFRVYKLVVYDLVP